MLTGNFLLHLKSIVQLHLQTMSVILHDKRTVRLE